MYPLAVPANARHRREPSVRQRIRGSLWLLAAIALIAAFGIFGGTVAGGQSLQTSLIAAAPVPPRVFGWVTCALPVAGLLGLLAPTPWRVLRAALSLLLLVPGVVLMALMSKPRGIDASEWAVDAAFAQAQSVTTYVLAAAAFVWAIAATIVVAARRPNDVVLKLRRSILWAGPLTIAASLTFALSA